MHTSGRRTADFARGGLDLATFGQRLRHLRRARGTDPGRARANAVGRAPSQLSLLENGRREPKLSLIRRWPTPWTCPPRSCCGSQPPSRRAQLEIALEEAQRDPLYAELGLPHLQVGARVPNDVLEHLVALHAELRAARRQADRHARRRPGAANAELRRQMRERGNYFARDRAGRRGGAGRGRLPRRRAVPGHAAARSSPTTASPCATSRTCRARSGRSPTCATAASTCKQESLGMHTPRTILLQTLGHFVLGHAAPRDFADFLRQRVEANYFAAAVLSPSTPRSPFLQRGQGGSATCPSRTCATCSRSPTRWPRTGSPTSPPTTSTCRCHFVRNDEGGIIYKAYENDGLVLPADATGAIEGQRMCRYWSGRQVFAVAGPLLAVLPVLRHAVGHLLVRGPRRPGPGARLRDHPGRAATSTRGGSAAGRPPTGRRRAARTATAASGRPPGSPPAGRAWPGRRRGPTRTSCPRCPPGSFPGVDETDVYAFLEHYETA